MHTMLTPTHMYARVYKDTHCSLKCHLAKFCFDRINHLKFSNKNVWVPIITNPNGPKKIWVPKSLPLVFDVGVGSHKILESWSLDGGFIWS